jgi:hypothetical protein
MPTETIETDGITGVWRDLWTLVGTTKTAAMSDASDATFLDHPTVNERQNLTLASPVVGAGAILSIDSMDMNFRAAELGGDCELRVGFQTQAGTACDATAQVLTTTITDYIKTGIGNPAAACGAWTHADVVTADTTMYISASGGNVRVYKLNVTMTYTLMPSGGFVWLLANCLPPLLAAYGEMHALSFRDIAAMFVGHKTRPHYREDFEAIRRGLLVRPRFA